MEITAGTLHLKAPWEGWQNLPKIYLYFLARAV